MNITNDHMMSGAKVKPQLCACQLGDYACTNTTTRQVDRARTKQRWVGDRAATDPADPDPDLLTTRIQNLRSGSVKAL